MSLPTIKISKDKAIEKHQTERSNNARAKYMEIYLCRHCGFDSGLPDTETNKRCFGCERSDGLTLLHREKISLEVIAKRIAYSARRMNMALRGAYNLVDKKSFLEIWNSPDLLVPDVDEEKRMLDLLARGKDLEDSLTGIFSEKKKPVKRRSTSSRPEAHEGKGKK
jgi:hypothetical protein